MKIPKIISKNNHEYIFKKQYPNYVLYVDLLTGVKECFSYHELGMIKDVSSEGGEDKDNVKNSKNEEIDNNNINTAGTN